MTINLIESSEQVLLVVDGKDKIVPGVFSLVDAESDIPEKATQVGTRESDGAKIIKFQSFQDRIDTFGM